MSYSFKGEITEKISADINDWLQKELNSLLGEADTVLIEYVTTMVVNRKTMSEMASDLADFFGENDCSTFVKNLQGKLSSLEKNSLSETSKSSTISTSKVLSLTSSKGIDVNDLLSKPLGSSRNASDKKDNKGSGGGSSSNHNNNQKKGSNRLLNAAIEQSIIPNNKRGVVNSDNRGGGNSHSNKKARNIQMNQQAALQQQQMNMNMFAQMHGFNDPSELMMMYQQNMLNMMQSVLAPVINATADIIGGRGGRGGQVPGRGGRFSRGTGINSSGRPHFLGRGQGRGNTDTTHLSSEVVQDPNAAADISGNAGSVAGVGAETNKAVELDSSGQENPSAATFDGTFSGGRFSGRGRGRGRMMGRFRGGRSGRGGRVFPVAGHKTWVREPEVEASLPATR